MLLPFCNDIKHFKTSTMSRQTDQKPTISEKKVSLKLLVDAKAKKVLFAEACKDFVDFLFHILSLPIATAIKILTTQGMVGCLGDLYKSIETLNTDYLQPNFNIDSLVKPTTQTFDAPVLLLTDEPVHDKITPKKFYTCPSNLGYSNHCKMYISDSSSAVCPECSRKISTEATFVAPIGNSAAKKGETSGDGGFVKGVVTYMVMDNLEIKPMSTISGITLINKFNVKDVASLVEKQVQFGLIEGIALLKASLETQAVLTTVFLGNKA